MSQTKAAINVKTIFCDIDGCILKHQGNTKDIQQKCELLPGVLETFVGWIRKGYTIILTTGRKESMRRGIEGQLRSTGISYDLLIMGLPRGQRVVINDIKPESKEPTAACVNVERNEGLENVDI